MLILGRQRDLPRGFRTGESQAGFLAAAVGPLGLSRYGTTRSSPSSSADAPPQRFARRILLGYNWSTAGLFKVLPNRSSDRFLACCWSCGAEARIGFKDEHLHAEWFGLSITKIWGLELLRYSPDAKGGHGGGCDPPKFLKYRQLFMQKMGIFRLGPPPPQNVEILVPLASGLLMVR